MSSEKPPPSADEPTQKIPRVVPGAGGHGQPVVPPVSHGHVPVQVPHTPPAQMPAGYLPVMPGGAAPPPPPAVTPPAAAGQGHGRGAGFWIATAAGVASLAMLLLIGGFFIGRSTRDSAEQVQAKIQAQKQADQIAQTKQLQEIADKLRTERANAVRKAADRARARGIREGRSEGRQVGYEEGRQQGQTEGESSGFAQGQSTGYSSGFDDALCLADVSLC